MTDQQQPFSMAERLAVIDTKLDILIEQRSDHEVRLRALEKFKWLMVGAAAMGGGAAGSIASVIANG